MVEAIEWLHNFKLQTVNFKLILCVPFTLLYPLKHEISRLKLSLELGAQDVSPFPDGAYTGEVNARQVKELADWVIIGHSERRRDFSEGDELLFKKSMQAKQAGLKVIYCVQDEQTTVAPDVDVIAYEPPWAISAVSNWKTQDPKVAGQVCASIKERHPDAIVLYGGSASAENVQSFISLSSVDGVLSGGASLDPEKFSRLITAASVLASYES